jgi:hypothetical protein
MSVQRYGASPQRCCVCEPTRLRTCRLCRESFCDCAEAWPAEVFLLVLRTAWLAGCVAVRRSAYEAAPASVAAAEDGCPRPEGGGLMNLGGVGQHRPRLASYVALDQALGN